MKISVVIVNKDEATLADTLDALGSAQPGLIDEIVVVDASQRRLDHIRQDHPEVVWLDYEQPEGVRVTIPHQRNAGVALATGDVIVFTDSGCIPKEDWLPRLLAPILEDGEDIAGGPAIANGTNIYSGSHWWGNSDEKYVDSIATINIAFRREAFDAVGGFDERFGAGEDLDFCWRLVDAGYQLRWVPNAMVEHEWGDARRQLRRSYFYGVGWARLLRKHPRRLKKALRETPVALIYPLYLLGLPLTFKYRKYPLLLLIPLWRSRTEDRPFLVLLDHLVQGVGVIAEVTGLYR